MRAANGKDESASSSDDESDVTAMEDIGAEMSVSQVYNVVPFFAPRG